MSSALGLLPSASWIDVEGDTVSAKMGWAFSATFPRSAVARVSRHESWTPSRGVHGFAGRWLVNGAGRGIARIDLTPEQRGRVMGFPVRLRELYVSVEDPAALANALGVSLGPPQK